MKQYFSSKVKTDEEKEITQFKKYNAVFKFNHRRVISVTGEDAEIFLQSMITNDMRLLKDNEVVSIFGLFLNPKGRVLYDAIIVKSHL
jgi:folate-binding Fe-S cluster repair protein YgfZ